MRIRPTAIVVALVVIVITLTVVQFPLLLGWLRRHVSQNWVLATLTAVIICCVVAHKFASFSGYDRFWVVLAVFLVLHFLLAVPVLARLGPVKFGFGELGLWLAVLLEGAVVVIVMRRATAHLEKKGK